MFDYFDIDLSWKSGETRVFLPIVISLIAFVVYWFISQSKNIKERFYRKHSFDTAAVKHIFFTKYLGFFSMGVIPLIICLVFIPEIPFSAYGVNLIPKTLGFSMLWILGLSALVIPIAYFSAKKPKNLVNFPQIRAKSWSSKTVFISLFGWFIYLLGYEILFRGVLLIPLVEPLGIWTAIAINVALYSATHIPKGIDETLGAIPLGIVLCILTVASGSIWIALFVHVAMAWTNDLISLRHNPEIHYRKKL